MKTAKLFKKASIFAIAIALALLMVASILPVALATDETTDHGEKLSASNITISGDITMVFYYTNLDNFADDDYIEITVPTQDNSSSVTRLKKSELDRDENGRYIVKVPVAYAQQADTITMQWFKKNVLGQYVGGTIRKKSVQSYAAKVLDLAKNSNDAELKAKCENSVASVVSMLNAGAMAQLSLGYNTDSLANAGLFAETSNPIDGMLSEHFYDVAYKPSHENTSELISFVGGRVFLQNKVNLRIYIDCPDTVATAAVSNGASTQTVRIKTDSDGRKYIGINNITATSFNTRFTITVTYNGVSESFSYSVLDYAKDTLAYGLATKEQQNTAKALYLFYAYTRQYVDNTYAPGPKDASGVSSCKHERSYLRGELTVCSDCGVSFEATQVVLSATANDIVAGQTGKASITITLKGDVTLTAISFKINHSDKLTLSATDDTAFASGLNGDIANNVLIICENPNGSFTAGELVTIAYDATAAEAGSYKISIVVNEATDANGKNLSAEEIANIVTGIATINVEAKKCEEHANVKYISDGTTHTAYCADCWTQMPAEEHNIEGVSWSPVSGKDENGMLHEQKLCSVCGYRAESRIAASVKSIDNIFINSEHNAAQYTGGTSVKTNVYEADTAKYNQSVHQLGIGGWAAINSSTARFVYRVNGGKWQNAHAHTWNLAADAGTDNPYVKYVEISNAGVEIKDYRTNLGFSSGIYTTDLQDYVGQTVTVEFGAVPKNNPGHESDPNAVVIYTFENVTIACDHTRDTSYTIDASKPQFVSSDSCSVCGEAFSTLVDDADNNGTLFFNAEEIFHSRDTDKEAQAKLVTRSEDEPIEFTRIYSVNPGGAEEYLFLFDSTNKATNAGDYVAILYRNSVSNYLQLYIDSNSGSVSKGVSTGYGTPGEWTFEVIEVNYTISTFDGKNVRAIRFDYFNNGANQRTASDYVDVAFVAFFNSKQEAIDYYGQYAKAYFDQNTCQHLDKSYTATDDITVYNATCDHCGKDLGAISGITQEGLKIWNASEFANIISSNFTSTTLESDVNYGLDYAKIRYTKVVSGENFIYITPTKAATKNLTGKYIAMIYRSFEARNHGNIYIVPEGTSASGPYGSWSGNSLSNSVGWEMTIWDYTEICKNTGWTPDVGYNTIRWDIEGTTAVGYGIDVAYFATFNSKEEAEAFFARLTEERELDVKFRVTFDSAACAINGDSTGVKQTWLGKPAEYDLTNKPLQTPKSITVGGWITATNGIQSYGLRIKKADGTVEESVWFTGGAHNSAGKLMHESYPDDFTDKAGNGASFSVRTPDLNAYSGQTIDFEILAYAYDKNDNIKTLVVASFKNVQVPCVHNEYNEKTTTATENPMFYNTVCECGYDLGNSALNQQGYTMLDADRVYSIAQRTENSAGRTISLMVDEGYGKDSMPFVRIMANTATTGESFFYINNVENNKITNVGEVVVILYRSYGLTSGTGSGRGGAEMFSNSDGSQLAGKHNAKITWTDGLGWQLAVFDYTANENVSKDEGFAIMRWDIFNGAVAAGVYVDVAYIGFFDSAEAANEFQSAYGEYYGVTLGTDKVPYRVTYDNVYVNGTALKGKAPSYGMPGYHNFASQTLDTRDSFAIQGWFVAESGTNHYEVIYTDTKGNPLSSEAAQTWTGSDKTTSTGHQGVVDGLGLSREALKGAGWTVTINIPEAYAGQTVNIQLWAVTNDGRRILMTTYASVNVPQ